jgi:hypothetical protein
LNRVAAVTPPLLPVPASMVPVAAQVRVLLGDHDEVTDAGVDGAVTPGALVRLSGGVRLHQADDFYP